MKNAEGKGPKAASGKRSDPRADRLAEALKANLRRRKAQARGRRDAREDDAPPSDGGERG